MVCRLCLPGIEQERSDAALTEYCLNLVHLLSESLVVGQPEMTVDIYFLFYNVFSVRFT